MLTMSEEFQLLNIDSILIGILKIWKQLCDVVYFLSMMNNSYQLKFLAEETI